MSERKVLTKYYPPDFDPSAITRQRKHPSDGPTKLPTVRLMAPFAMKCTACGEYIYKGRKFNARKQLTDMKYYNIGIIRFYIRCTRCSSEMTFLTDPKNNDYASERGMRRNFEPWREAKLAEETEEERLDRIEREEAERDPMKELEEKAMDAKTEMEVADKLDEIRTRNARLERRDREGVEVESKPRGKTEAELERERQEKEDEEVARRAFLGANGEKVKRLVKDDEEDEGTPSTKSKSAGDSLKSMNDGVRKMGFGEVEHIEDKRPAPAPSFARAKKKKVDRAAALGIKKKVEPAVPVVSVAESDDSFW